jgi:short-subunit dehydrogenase
LEKWAKTRKGKKCAIVNYSSLLTQIIKPNFATYAATKAYNDVFARSLQVEYSQSQEVDLDVLTVYPGNVKSQMNSGRYTFTTSAENHARSVVNSIGWETTTQGDLLHGVYNFLNQYRAFTMLDNWVNKRRFQAFLLENQKKA